MNRNFVLFVFCAMVHSTGAIIDAPERVVHDILSSTAFNVAMFAMGWAATRLTMKGSEPAGLQWLRTLASIPLPPMPLSSKCKTQGDCAAADTPPSSDDERGADDDEETKDEMQPESPWQDAEDHDSTSLLAGLCSILTRRISSADVSQMPPWRRCCFHSKESELSLADYATRTFWYFECSTPCLVLALIYLDRLLARSPTVALTSETSQRLFLTSLLMAAKFNDDETALYPNDFYADVGSVAVDELNAMEKRFCKLIDWQFCVKQEEYLRYVDLMTAAAHTPFAA